MSITIEQDLKEVLAKIDQKLDNLTGDIAEIRQKDLVELKVGQAEIKGDIKALEEKVKGVDERLKNQKFLSKGILVGLIVAILGGLAKLFGLVGNP
ncbi:MAG: hypothetical protein AB4426_20405 [Xenococcaceae cyanobacterium]